MLLDSLTKDSQSLPSKEWSGYEYEGKEVVTLGQRGRPPRYNKNPNYYSLEEKTNAATLYCVYGDLQEVAKITGLPIPVIRDWKNEPWWTEIQKQVFVEQNEKLSSQISTVLGKAIEQITDRLDHGDQTYNPKTGQITRKPIEARVLAGLFDSLAHQRRVTRGEPTSITAKVMVDDRLKQLEEAFIRFSSAKDITNEATS
jgi:signal recognition particle subunit SEC65